jgi:aryl-alcohol dehydrogenase-like predicted oxidoreductase
MIPKLMFGRTGHLSTRIIFGGTGVSTGTQDDANRVLDLLLEHGINHIDTAASYGDSEIHIGPWMKEHRNDFFLATKTGERTYAKAKEELHRSLDRLQTDHVDLIQLHYLVQPDEWETALGPGGALEALIEAREQGLTRFIGVTGHDVAVPVMHMRSLDRFDFDSVLLPYNYPMMQNPTYKADFDALQARCQERNVAVQTIKGVARGPWGDQPHNRDTWYQPLDAQADIDKAVHYVLGRPGIYLNTAGDRIVLPRILDAAERFVARPSDEAMAGLYQHAGMAPLFV